MHLVIKLQITHVGVCILFIGLLHNNPPLFHIYNLSSGENEFGIIFYAYINEPKTH